MLSLAVTICLSLPPTFRVADAMFRLCQMQYWEDLAACDSLMDPWTEREVCRADALYSFQKCLEDMGFITPFENPLHSPIYRELSENPLFEPIITGPYASLWSCVEDGYLTAEDFLSIYTGHAH